MKPASRSLREYGQTQRTLMLIIFISSSVFLFLAIHMDGPVLDESLYGEMVLRYKAELWVVPLFLGSAAHLLATMINGSSAFPAYLTPFVRLIASMVCAADLLYFAYASLHAPILSMHIIYTIITGLACVLFSFWALGDLVRGIRSHWECS